MILSTFALVSVCAFPGADVAAKGLGDLELGHVRIDNARVDQRVADAVIDASLERSIVQASTFTITLLDDDRELLRSDLFGQRAQLRFNGLLFEQVQFSKSGDSLPVTFESAGVADLRREKGPRLFRRGANTRKEAAKRLVDTAEWLDFKGEDDVPLKEALLVKKNQNYWAALQAWASQRNWRCFESEGVVYFGSDEWLASLTPRPFMIFERDEAIDNIDFELDSGKRAETATIDCYAKRWAARPGAPVFLPDMGPAAEGMWLVQSIVRSVFSPKATVTLARKQKDRPEPKPEPVSTGSGEGGWQWPVRGTVTGLFGDDRGDHRHEGIDIAGPTGTPIRPTRPGRVALAGNLSGYGNVVYVDHGNGFSSRYAHLSAITCKRGDRLEFSSTLGRRGNSGTSTGPHLHFEILKGGVPQEPLPFLRGKRSGGFGDKGGDVNDSIDADGVKAKIRAVFGRHGRDAIRVAQCESSLRPGATNSYRGADGRRHVVRGLFQISDVHRGSYYPAVHERRLLTADYNIQVAHKIFRDQGWTPWSCKP